ncbi:MAG TPA: hypothetical protein PKH10_09095 [bacterium]|nr:hypothetical protein [bacterium]
MDLFHPHTREILVASALLVALLLILLRMIWSRRRTALRIKTDMLSVLPSLERLAEGDRAELSKWLRRAARRYPDEVRTFILLGDLLRAEGPLKAVFLHRTLLFRKKLSTADRASILLSLGRDHRALEDDQKALASLKQSLAAEKREETLKELVSLETAMGLFDDALYHCKELNRLAGLDRNEGLRAVMLDALTVAVSRNRPEEARRWGEMVARAENDTALALLIPCVLAAWEGKVEQARPLAEKLIERYPEEECTLRYLLLQTTTGMAFSRLLPGPLGSVFVALCDETRVLTATEMAPIEKKSALYYHLAARTVPPGETRDLLAAAGRRERLFACAACGGRFEGMRFSCPGCGLPVTVRPGVV